MNIFKTLIYVPFEEAIDGEKYITKTKHGWIEGIWDAESESCSGYYWQDIEWCPQSLWRLD